VAPDVAASEAEAHDVALRSALADVVAAADTSDAVRAEAQEALATFG